VTPLPPALFPTVGAALDWARRELEQSESGPLESQILLAHVSGRTRASLLAHPEAALTPEQSDRFVSLVRRIAGGEPLAYLTGRQEFFGLEFEVSPAVLIPRPETERMVETALSWLSGRRSEAARIPRPVRVVDLGTGCGCIAAALAIRTTEAFVVATDISSDALAMATRNLSRHGVRDRALLVQADLLASLRGPIDLLCTNLPYVPAGTLRSLPALRCEPRLALDGGPDGLRLIERALREAASRMADGGLALFEIEASHGEAAERLACNYFYKAEISVMSDLAGKPRILQVQL
jgi:release factor glutamine methyltransferase